MLGKFRKNVEKILSSISLNFYKFGIKPNHLTFLGLIFSILASFSFYFKIFFLAAFLLILTGLADILDGMIARLTSSVTKFGEVLDSVIDRYSDFLPIFFIGLSLLVDWIFVAFAIFGSLIPSFVRARVEASYSLNKKIEVVIGERSDRLVILIFATIIYPFFNFSLLIGLILIGLLGNVAAVLRIIAIFKNKNNRKVNKIWKKD